ncbi:MAG: serine/threonine protein kinase [Deltaproteobacteria bacterium]|nr:serine/threonine protein kinase [Deltaproteobacteria bacterium]
MHGSLESWSASLVGKTLAGRYRVTELLGAGGVGAVFTAEHVAVGRRVALKVLHPEFLAHGSVVDRFHREARAAAACAREGVVDVIDLDRDPACGPFLVMEYLEGETLAARLRARAPLSIDETLFIARSLLATLAVVHARGIVHRDLKPANVMLAQSPEGREVVKVLDFGLAREMTTSDRPGITLPGSVLGTPRFMAPEQAAGDPSVDARADIYAVGAILYCCLGARPPYADVPPEEALHAVLLRPTTPLDRLRPDLDPAVLAVVARAMARDRRERFPDVETLRTAMELAFVGFDDSSTLVDPSGERAVLTATPAPTAARDGAAHAGAALASTLSQQASPDKAAVSTMSYPPHRTPAARETPTTAVRTDPYPRSAHAAAAEPVTQATRSLRAPSSSTAGPVPVAAPHEHLSVSVARSEPRDARAVARAPRRASRGADWWWIVPVVVVGLGVVVGLPALFVSGVAGPSRFFGPSQSASPSPGAGAAPVASWRWQRQGRVTFAVPESWTPITSSVPSIVLALASPGVGDTMRPHVTLADEPFPGTLTRYIEIGTEAATRAGGMITSRSDLLLGTTPGFRGETLFQNAPTPYRELAVFAVVDGRGYALRCLVRPTDAAGLEVCRAISRTVRVE